MRKVTAAAATAASIVSLVVVLLFTYNISLTGGNLYTWVSGSDSDEGSWAINRRHPHFKRWCDKPRYRKNTVKVIREIPFSGLFHDLLGYNKFEGSGMYPWIAPNSTQTYLVVFDNLFSLGLVNDRFQFRSPGNRLIGAPGEDSQFEGIAVMPQTNHALILIESHNHGDAYRPETLEVEIRDDLSGYDELKRCWVDFELAHENKGFEGILYHWNGTDGFMLGLCEGNFCKGGKEGEQHGNGRLVVFTLDDTPSTPGFAPANNGTHSHHCRWEVLKVLEVPKTADFIDYSEISAMNNTIVITSQEDSALWIGQFDFDTLDFVDAGRVYTFPLDGECHQIYCNIEGVAFIDSQRLIVTSDKAKASQPHQCIAKDQSVHIITLP